MRQRQRFYYWLASAIIIRKLIGFDTDNVLYFDSRPLFYSGNRFPGAKHGGFINGGTCCVYACCGSVWILSHCVCVSVQTWLEESRPTSLHHERVWSQHQHWRPVHFLPDVRKLCARAPTLALWRVGVQPVYCWLCCRSQSTQQHLKNVYSSLALCMFVAAAGSYVHVVTGFFQVTICSPTQQYSLYLSQPVQLCDSQQASCSTSDTSTCFMLGHVIIDKLILVSWF